VVVPPLRERPDDILPLAQHAAIGVRGREIHFTRAAEHALTTFAWPGNVRQLQDVVKEAARRSDTIDVAQLPAAVLSGSTHRLSRIEAFERDEIVRALTQPGISMREAAAQLGMSRATLYRKVAHYGVRLDHRARL
jgi:transcriptional regulator of acetoin/glycerol metabolism